MGYKIWGCWDWVVNEGAIEKHCPHELTSFHALSVLYQHLPHDFAGELRIKEILEPPLEAYRSKRSWEKHWAELDFDPWMQFEEELEDDNTVSGLKIVFDAYKKLLWAFYCRTKVPIWICQVHDDADGTHGFEKDYYWSVTDVSTVSKLTPAGKALGHALTIETWVEGG